MCLRTEIYVTNFWIRGSKIFDFLQGGSKKNAFFSKMKNIRII